MLNRPATVEITKTSGLAGIAYWVNQKYCLTGEYELTKYDPLIVSLKAWVDKEYEMGRQTVITHEEMVKKIREFAPGRFEEK